MDEQEIEEMLTHVIDGAVSTIPEYLQFIEDENNLMMVEDSKEFIYGVVVGMSLGMGGAMLSARSNPPTEDDKERLRMIIHRRIPEIRDRISEMVQNS